MGLSRQQQEQFERDGFVVVPSVLDPSQVAELRDFFAGLFDEPARFPGDTDQIRNDICSRYPEVRFLLSHPPIVDALRDLLGEDFVFLPEMAVHDHRFGPWHKDTTSMEQEDLHFHWDDDFRMVQVGIYLQPNGEHGGGLDIVPGSHKERDPYMGQGLVSKLKRRLRFRRAHSIPNQAGDLVAFHMRADHQATQPRRGTPADIPAGHRKFAIFFVCSANTDHPRQYVDFITGREGYEYLEGHSYPPEVESVVEEKGLTLV